MQPGPLPKTVLILCGGKSEEHEISLISAKCVLDALDRSRFTPVIAGISRQGTWFLEEEDRFYLGELRADKIRLNESAPRILLVPYPSQDGRGRLEAGGKSITFDAVFPILHGTFGEDGTIQGLFEIMGVPYVGSGCGSSWICMDKVLAKTLCAQSGVRVADFVWLTHPDELSAKSKEVQSLGETVFVKPARSGSSVGVSRVTSLSGLPAAVAKAFQHDKKVMIEKAISGREIECAVLGEGSHARASLPGEIVVSQKIGWYSYEAKYLLKDGAETIIPAPLDSKLTQAIQAFAVRVFRLLECEGMARVDLFLENGTQDLILNEVNTIPGFTPISMYPKMWEASGLPYSALISELIALAMRRHSAP